MEIRKAVQRIGWRFAEAAKRQDRSFRLNDNDIQALEVIDSYVVKAQKQQFINQELFAKMYIFLFMKIMEADNSTVLETFARRKIYDVLDKSISQLVDDFTESLNSSEAYVFLEEIGAASNLNGNYNSVKENEIKNKLSESCKDPDNLNRLIGKVWDREFVAEMLEVEVNQAINYKSK